MNREVTDWKYSFQEELESERGETGYVTGRSEILHPDGVLRRSFRLEMADGLYVWVPQNRLKHAERST